VFFLSCELSLRRLLDLFPRVALQGQNEIISPPSSPVRYYPSTSISSFSLEERERDVPLSLSAITPAPPLILASPQYGSLRADQRAFSANGRLRRLWSAFFEEVARSAPFQLRCVMLLRLRSQCPLPCTKLAPSGQKRLFLSPSFFYPLFSVFPRRVISGGPQPYVVYYWAFLLTEDLLSLPFPSPLSHSSSR